MPSGSVHKEPRGSFNPWLRDDSQSVPETDRSRKTAAPRAVTHRQLRPAPRGPGLPPPGAGGAREVLGQGGGPSAGLDGCPCPPQPLVSRALNPSVTKPPVEAGSRPSGDPTSEGRVSVHWTSWREGFGGSGASMFQPSMAMHAPPSSAPHPRSAACTVCLLSARQRPWTSHLGPR